MGDISAEDMKKIVEEVRKKVGEALLGDEASFASAGPISTCFRCGRLGTFKCEDTEGFECTTTFRCGNGFIRFKQL